jgi:hypothetical protein
MQHRNGSGGKLRQTNTGCASYFWTTIKQLGRGLNIVFEFFAFQTEYSLASADAKTSTKGSVAPTIQQKETNRATNIGGLCAGQSLQEVM